VKTSREGTHANSFSILHFPFFRRLGEKVGEIVGGKVGEALTSNQRQILTLLRENPRMAAREVAQYIGISSRKVEETIAKLKALTLLKRIGPAKEGYWQVTES
jgi:ATP-dependent DNA helicase RecG